MSKNDLDFHKLVFDTFFFVLFIENHEYFNEPLLHMQVHLNKNVYDQPVSNYKQLLNQNVFLPLQWYQGCTYSMNFAGLLADTRHRSQWQS